MNIRVNDTIIDSRLQQMELPLKTWEETDVEMAISHCGVCGSDIHTLNEGWGKTQFPAVVGHEIVGICTRVGKGVKHIRVGDRIGVGAQCDSCGECEDCKRGDENICKEGLLSRGGTYNGNWKNGDRTFGGYADYWVSIQMAFTYKRITHSQVLLERQLSFCVQDSL